MITFRELQFGDLDFLVEVRNECRAKLHDNTEFTLAQARAWFETAHPRFYLILNGDIPIGYFRTSQWSDRHRHVCIGCDLHASHRGKGFATAAYPRFLRFLFEEHGMNKVSLEVLSPNRRAARLYQRLGFVVEGVKRQEIWRDGGYLDSVLMSMLKSEFFSLYGDGRQGPDSGPS